MEFIKWSVPPAVWKYSLKHTVKFRHLCKVEKRQEMSCCLLVIINIKSVEEDASPEAADYFVSDEKLKMSTFGVLVSGTLNFHAASLTENKI